MILGVFVKMFSDACVCFAILGALYTVFTFSYQPVYAAILCACGVTVAAAIEDSRKPAFRWLGILFPMASLLLADGIGNMLILLPVVIYAVIVISRGQYHLEYYTFRSNFRSSLILLGGIFVLFYALSYLEKVTYGGKSTIDAMFTLRYGIAHGISGVFLQRHLRLGAEDRSRSNSSQFAVILGGIGAVMLAFAASEPLLYKGAVAVCKFFASLVLAVPLAFYHLYCKLVDQIEVKQLVEEIDAGKITPEAYPAQPGFEQFMQQAAREPSRGSSYLMAVLAVVLVIGVMAWMIIVYRKQGKQALSRQTDTRIAPPEQKKRESRRSNRGKVRHYYREYLRMEQNRGLVLRKYMTTEDILKKVTQETNEQAASDLRQVYLRARYDEKAEITREQAEKAKEALKRSRTT